MTEHLLSQRATAWRESTPGIIMDCVAVAIGSCTMTETQQRTASGAGIGAGVGAAGGALIGALTGNVGAGAAIGRFRVQRWAALAATSATSGGRNVSKLRTTRPSCVSRTSCCASNWRTSS